MDSNLEKIWDYFALLAGLDEDSRDRWLPLCSAANDDLRARLRSTSLSDDENNRVNRAAATLAFLWYSRCASSDQIQSFEAGDVRVSLGTSSSASGAMDLWNLALAGIASLLTDTDGEFVFSRVIA